MSILGGSRQVLLHGMVLALTGLAWGLVVPATPHPRLALAAHIQLMTNGMLLIVLATALLTLTHRVGLKSVKVLVLAAWLTWGVGLSEMANSWWGTKQMLPIAASQAGAAGGQPWQELTIMITHACAGLALIVACALIVIGFARPTERATTA